MKKEKITKTWEFDSKEEAVDFFITALAIRTPYPKIVELKQPNKVKITKL